MKDKPFIPDESSIFDNEDKERLSDHNAAMQQEKNELLMKKKLKEIKRNYKKPGPKGIVVNKAFLNKLYKLVFKGLEYHNQIYPKMGVGHSTWADLLNNYPEILETIECAKNDRVELVLSYYDDILLNPKHRSHPDFVKDSVKHFRSQNEKPKELKVEITNLEKLSEEELLKKLDE